MNAYKSAEQFLQAVFADYACHGIFANLNPPAHTRQLKELDRSRDCYWSIAAFPPGALTNRKEDALEVRALVIDDVGTKVPAGVVELALGKPTAIVETSAGNFQWSYRLSRPIVKHNWDSFFSGAEALIGHNKKLDAPAAQTLMRLPMGVNSKPGKDGFAVRLVALNPEIEIDPATIPQDVQRVTKAAGRGACGTLKREALEQLMALIPNDLERDGWIEVGHGLKALCADDEDGFEVFDAWSQLHLSYDAGKTRAAWDSFGAGGLKTQGGMLRARAEKLNPAAFRKWEAAVVFDDGIPAPPVTPGRAQVQFQRGGKGEVLRSRVNAERGLLGLGIACRYDAFHHRMHIERGETSEAVTDHAVMLLRVELTDVYGKDFGTVVMWDAVISLALQNQFNPVCEMLAAAEAAWDGVRRLDRLGPDYFNTEDTEPARACFRKVMIAAVRRARKPGCKFDQILVCESPEGWNKSSAWEVLAGRENFSDESILGKNTREVQEQLADIWIHENADLAGLNKSEVEHVKAFASRTVDRARPAYARELVNQPRQSIEVGTTNAEVYLLSPTGNRRFWGFTLSRWIDLALLRRDRLQLWGEAAAYESAGETLVLAEHLWPIMGEAQEKRRVIDTWEIELENLPPNLMEDRNGWLHITGLAVQEYLSGYRRQTFNSGSGRKIAEIMRRLGWESTVFKVDGKATRGYKRELSTISNSSVNPSVTENPF